MHDRTEELRWQSLAVAPGQNMTTAPRLIAARVLRFAQLLLSHIKWRSDWSRLENQKQLSVPLSVLEKTVIPKFSQPAQFLIRQITQENNHNKLTNAIYTTNWWWIDWCYLSQQSNKISRSSHQQKINKSDEFWLWKWCPNNGTLWKNKSLRNSIKFSYLDDISTKVLQTYGQNNTPPPPHTFI